MSSFCIANLLSPKPKNNDPIRPSSSQKSSPTATKPSTLDFQLPVGSAPLLTAVDLIQMANATMMNQYGQPTLNAIFNPSINPPNAYPFAQFPPFFVNGFPNNGYFGPNVFQSPNGVMLQQLSGRRKRRHRTIFTDEQLAVLESNFNSNAYPDINLREKLAIQCDLKEERVEVWFKNRRAKERKKRHDFSNGDNPINESTENGTTSPFFEQSSSSEHKNSDDSDCEDYKHADNNFLLAKLSTPGSKTPNSATPIDNTKQKSIPTSTNKRKKRPSDNLSVGSPPPDAKKLRVDNEHCE